MNDHDRQRPAAQRAAGGEGKRPYRKPRLIEYGSVAKLTQGTATYSSDGPGGGFKMTCF